MTAKGVELEFARARGPGFDLIFQLDKPAAFGPKSRFTKGRRLGRAQGHGVRVIDVEIARGSRTGRTRRPEPKNGVSGRTRPRESRFLSKR